MSNHMHERPRQVIEEYPLLRRENILNRLEACKNNIHSPWSWYSEDVRMLLISLDFLHTRYVELMNRMEES